MRKLLFLTCILSFSFLHSEGQKVPTGNPKDFKVKTCLHSVGYSGAWRGQAELTLDEFLLKAKELGFDEVNMPNVKAAFDCWSPTMEGLSSDEIKKAIYTMKPYIVHTTCADYEKLPRFRYESAQVNYVPLLPENRLVPIGEGYLDYKTFITTLKEIGYQGYIAFEMCAELKGGGSIENLDKTARAFLEYVKQFE